MFEVEIFNLLKTYRVENKIRLGKNGGGGSSFIGVKLDTKKNLLNRKKMIQISPEIKDMIISVIKND